MTAPTGPRGAQLVGSVSLRDAETVFRTVSGILGGHLRRIPDGETGERTIWAAWQVPRLGRNPAFKLKVPPGLMGTMLTAYARVPFLRSLINNRMAGRLEQGGPVRLIRIRQGVRPEQIAIGPLGYAAYAKASYATFTRLKGSGVIPRGVRFQVSLPSPIAPLASFSPNDMAIVLPRYTDRMLAELDEITAAVPPGELAIQWDVAVEFAMLEGVAPSPYGSPEESFEPLTTALVRLGDAVPRDVELGYHLCYGDAAHRHFVQPRDTALLTRVANALAAGVSRPITWLHFPVPRDRTDAGYFAPMAEDLRLDDSTELYVGLVHLTDGVDGGRRRIAIAQATLPRGFGIGTECGFGRRQPNTVTDLLRLHAELAAPLDAAELRAGR